MEKKYTPMMQQYLNTKEQYKDCLLFYRLGDFYELFYEDAIIASRVLDLTLTGRNCGVEDKAPMCGVPYHAAETYISRLLLKAYACALSLLQPNIAPANIPTIKTSANVIKSLFFIYISPFSFFIIHIVFKQSNSFFYKQYIYLI